MGDDILSKHDGKYNGASEKLDPNQTEPQQVLANKGGDDLSPELVTIQCSLDIINPNAAPPGVVGVEGFLDWGVGGCSHIARFDWLQGCSMTLCATSFKLRARLRQAPVPGTNVFAKASICYGTKAVVSLQLSSDYYPLEPGVSQIIDIPPWATHGLLVVVPFDVLPFRQVLLEPMTFDNQSRYEVRPNDCTESNRFPLTFDVQRLKVTNQSYNPMRFCIIWRLAL
jgi:hypothetical protein